MVKEWSPPPGGGVPTGPPPTDGASQDDLDALEEMARGDEEAPPRRPKTAHHLPSRSQRKGSPPPLTPAEEALAEPVPVPLFKRIAPDLPMLIIGGAFFVGAFLFFSHGATIGNRAYPLWVLCVALGSVAATGSLVSMYVGPDPPFVNPEEYLYVRREEWEATRRELAELRRAAGLAPEGPGGEAQAPVHTEEEHRSLLTSLDTMGKPVAEPAAAPRSVGVAPAAMAAAARPAATGSWSAPPPLLPKELVGPSAAPPKPGSQLLPREVPKREPVEEPVDFSEVEIPPTTAESTEDLRKELESQIRRALPDMRDLPPVASPTPAKAPSGPAPRLPAPVPSVPAPRAPAPSVVPAPAPSQLPVAPTPEVPPPAPTPEESYDEEEAPATNGAEAKLEVDDQSTHVLGEIEELAKKFGVLGSHAGALGAEAPPASEPNPLEAQAPPTPMARALAPSAPAAPQGQVWQLPTLRSLRPWPGASRLEWELACVRVAVDYTVRRLAGEEPEAFLDRAEVLLQRGVPVPPADRIDLTRAASLFDCLLQGYRRLSVLELQNFVREIRPEVERMGRSIGTPMAPGEDPITYAQRMMGALKEFERTGVRPVTPEAAASMAAAKSAGEAPPSEPGGAELDEELDRLVSDLKDDHLSAGADNRSKRRKKARDNDEEDD